jgi:hypothetical protein
LIAGLGKDGPDIPIATAKRNTRTCQAVRKAASRGPLKWLYRTTVTFYLLMAGAYLAILISAINVHIHPIEKATALSSSMKTTTGKDVPKP